MLPPPPPGWHAAAHSRGTAAGASLPSLHTQQLALRQQRTQQHHIKQPAAAAAAATPAPVPTARQPLPPPDAQSLAAVMQLVSARALDPDPELVAQEAHLTLAYLSSQQGALPPQLTDAAGLAEHALLLTDLMATGSTFRTLQMLKRHPALLQLSACEVADKVLQLKLLMPAADISRLLYQKPTLLLIEDMPAVVGVALNKLHALMPGIPIEAKLHEGGTVFWSFSSILQDSSSLSSSRARPGGGSTSSLSISNSAAASGG